MSMQKRNARPETMWFREKKDLEKFTVCAHRALMGKAKERSTSRIASQSTAAKVMDELNRIEKDYDSYFV